jgi:hypothetical protein
MATLFGKVRLKHFFFSKKTINNKMPVIREEAKPAQND